MADPIEVLEQIVRGLRADAATRQGGWSLGQALAHCAQSIELSLVGYPQLRSGLFRATIGPLAKRKFLRAGRMSHDLTAHIPGAPPLGDVTFDDARERALAAVATFKGHTGELAPHLAYGRCTKDEYAALHLLHVEDHLRGLGVATD